MAVSKNTDITGPIGDLSHYRMRGVRGTVVRKKGGASKKRIQTAPEFELTRCYGAEFGGCSTMGSTLRRMLAPIRQLSDYNFSGDINGLLSVIQKQDKVSDLGRRAIRLSQHPRLLEGFPLNDNYFFDAVIRNPLTYSLDQETGTAQIDIPALIRDINFFPANHYPLFRITVCLGIVPDFAFNESTKEYESPAWYDTNATAEYVSTPWHPAAQGSPATTLSLTVPLDGIPADGVYTLMLSVGIGFGKLYEGGIIVPVKRVGAAKILALKGKNGSAKRNPDEQQKGKVEVVAPLVKSENTKQGSGGGYFMYVVNVGEGMQRTNDEVLIQVS